MSNPAVIKLQKKKINNSSVWLDDNFGEAIHLHIDNIRVDMTNSEFNILCSDLCDTINELVSVEGFNCHNISPVYLECMLWEMLPNLIEVRIDNVALNDLICPEIDNTRVHLSESRCLLALSGDSEGNQQSRQSDLASQTPEARLEEIYNSILENGYPYNNEYIIVYGEDNIIRDGLHRAACLWKINGNIEVPIMRLIFKNYSTPPERTWYQKNEAISNTGKTIRRIINPKNLSSNMRSISKKRKQIKNEIEYKDYISKHKNIDYIKSIIDSK